MIDESGLRHRIALPSGKSLEARTIELLKKAGITIRRSSERAYTGQVIGCSVLKEAIFCRPYDIGALVASGKVDFGITGGDTLIESGARVRISTELGYNR